jgi:hypothetical protein
VQIANSTENPSQRALERISDQWQHAAPQHYLQLLEENCGGWDEILESCQPVVTPHTES